MILVHLPGIRHVAAASLPLLFDPLLKKSKAGWKLSGDTGHLSVGSELLPVPLSPVAHFLNVEKENKLHVSYFFFFLLLQLVQKSAESRSDATGSDTSEGSVFPRTLVSSTSNTHKAPGIKSCPNMPAGSAVNTPTFPTHTNTQDEEQ